MADLARHRDLRGLPDPPPQSRPARGRPRKRGPGRSSGPRGRTWPRSGRPRPSPPSGSRNLVTGRGSGSSAPAGTACRPDCTPTAPWTILRKGLHALSGRTDGLPARPRGRARSGARRGGRRVRSPGASWPAEVKRVDADRTHRNPGWRRRAHDQPRVSKRRWPTSKRSWRSSRRAGSPLNESLALFEKGVKLARFLRAELDKAERKVEILLKDEKGELKAEDFEAGDGRRRGTGEDGGNDDAPAKAMTKMLEPSARRPTSGSSRRRSSRPWRRRSGPSSSRPWPGTAATSPRTWASSS